MSKHSLKTKAQNMRRKGRTYSEILKHVPVAKSTLSSWLHEVGLSKSQKQRITEKRKQAQMKGAAAQKNKRISRQSFLIEEGFNEVKSISNRELLLLGAALYWAEGGKEKEGKPGTGSSFSNSDPKMLALFIKWLKECVNVKNEDISADLYIHESHKHNIEKVLKKWSILLHKPRSFFKFVYLKKNKINTKRKNTGALYIGLLRVNIRASSNLNRKITGLIKGICVHCGIV